jgi:hypothetical protein
MPDTQEQLLTFLTEVSQEDYVRFVKDPTTSPDSSNMPFHEVIARIVTPYKLNVSITGGNLTVEIVHASDGASISAARPMVFKIGDTFRLATSALSTTKNAGTNWCNAGGAETATLDVDFFVYVLYETGASAGVKMFFSRYIGNGTMGVHTNTITNQKYPAGNWTNHNATDRVENVGRFRAVLSAGAGFTWSFNSQFVIHSPVHESDWLSFNPVVTASSGTITTVTLGTSNVYRVSKGLLHAQMRFIVTNNGTGAGLLRTTLPFSAISLGFVGNAVNMTSGNQGNGRILGGSITMDWALYNGTYPVASTHEIRLSISGLWI